MYIPAGDIFFVIMLIIGYICDKRGRRTAEEKAVAENKKIKLGTQGKKVLNRCTEIIDVLENKFHFIEKTVPGTTTSRKQKYRLTDVGKKFLEDNYK